MQTPQPHKARTAEPIFVVVLNDCTVRASVDHHHLFNRRVGLVGKPAGLSARKGNLPAVVILPEVLHSLLRQVLLALIVIEHYMRRNSLAGYHRVQIGLVTRQIHGSCVDRGCYVAAITLKGRKIACVPIGAHDGYIRFCIIFSCRFPLGGLRGAMSALALLDGNRHVLNIGAVRLFGSLLLIIPLRPPQNGASDWPLWLVWRCRT